MMLNKVETCSMKINKIWWLDQVSVTSQGPLNLFISSFQTNPDICNWYLVSFMTCNYQITMHCIQDVKRQPTEEMIGYALILVLGLRNGRGRKRSRVQTLHVGILRMTWSKTKI